MKNYSKLIASIKEKSINDEEVSYSKKKKGFLNKNTLKVLVLSLLAVGVVNANATKVNATTNDNTIYESVELDKKDEKEFEKNIIALIAIGIGIGILKRLFSYEDRSELLFFIGEDKLKKGTIESYNKNYYDYSILAKEVINTKLDFDINIILYSIFINLKLSEMEEAYESMDMLFMEMQKLIKGQESDYSLEIVESCNHGSFIDYLKFKGFSNVKEYVKYMKTLFFKNKKKEDKDLFNILNSQELEYKYIGDFLLNCKDLNNIDLYITDLYLNIIRYLNFKNMPDIKDEKEINEIIEINFAYAIDKLDCVFSYMHKKIKGHVSEYQDEILSSCNYKSFFEYVLHKGYSSIDDYRNKVDETVINSIKNEKEMEMKRTLHM